MRVDGQSYSLLSLRSIGLCCMWVEFINIFLKGLGVPGCLLISENHEPNFHGRQLDVETSLFANKEMILRFKHEVEKN